MRSGNLDFFSWEMNTAQNLAARMKQSTSPDATLALLKDPDLLTLDFILQTVQRKCCQKFIQVFLSSIQRFRDDYLERLWPWVYSYEASITSLIIFLTVWSCLQMKRQMELAAKLVFSLLSDVCAVNSKIKVQVLQLAH